MFTPDQKLEYAKLMIEEGYTNQKVMEISGTGASAVMRWKKQYQGGSESDVINSV